MLQFAQSVTLFLEGIEFLGITIYDIAKKVGTSHGTVSRALNDHPRISKKTKARILAVAEELGYRPMNSARTLKSGKTNTIGLVIPDVRNPFYTEFLRIVELACLERGCHLMAVEYALDNQRQRGCLERMLESRCDGVLAFLTLGDVVEDLLDEFWAKKVPCIQVVNASDKWDGIAMQLDDGMNKAVDHLVSLGHKNIALACSISGVTKSGIAEILKLAFGGQEGQVSGMIGAFVKSHLKHGLELDDKKFLLNYSGEQRVDGVQAANDLLSRKEPITAVIAQNDLFAVGLMQGLAAHGIRIPDDVSVIGCDNSWLAECAMVPLTTIDLKIKQLAEMCVDMVFDRMESSKWDKPQRNVITGIDLVVRQSTGPVGRGIIG